MTPTQYPQPIPADQRSSMIAATILTRTRQGWRVESQSQFGATLVHGRRVNHVLHLILSLVTVGLWVPVWIVLAIVGGEKRQSVFVDEFGHITNR
jgi:hypothetical protein